MPGPTETRTRIAGFRVQSANHYTIGPCLWAQAQKIYPPVERHKSYKIRARPGFEPGTSRTLSENHTPRPTSHMVLLL